jgi:hypothetical protein
VIAESRSRDIDFPLCLLGTVLIIVGCFGPWIPHRTAALTVTGYELGEFAKFFPEVQGGVISINRPLFYSPFVGALLLIAFFAGRSTTRCLRLAASLIVAVIFLVALLPYSVIDSVRQAFAARSVVALDPNYTGQLVLVSIGIALALAAPLAHRLSRRLQGFVVAFMALVGVIPALWQFALLRPLIVALYGVPLALGWGVIVCAIGSGLVLFWGMHMAVKSERRAVCKKKGM